MIVDFTATACARPGIFRDTLESFRENLLGVSLSDCTLYLNVDPRPVEVPQQNAVAIAEEFFGRVVSNCPPEANFAAAVKWCWQQPVTAYFFSLEDDWILLRPIEIEDMRSLLLHDLGLACVNLRAYPHDDDRLCLAPGLWRSVAAWDIAERMRTDENPERQLRKAGTDNPYGGLHHGYRGAQYPQERVLRDIGRVWLMQTPYRREGGKRFVKWERATA